LELPDAPLQTLPPSDAHRAWGGGAQAFAYFWDGAGPTVALVHGWGGCAGIWSLWVGQLLRAGYRVVSIDAPAHGAAPGNRASAPAIAGTVRAASREVGPFAATVSHSLGAIASTLAAADGEPLLAMVHLAACVEVDATLLETARYLDLPRERIPALRERLAERFGEDLTLTTAMARVARPAKVLFVHDPEDPIMAFANAERAADLWEGTRCETVAGVGHERIVMARGAIQAGIAFLKEHLPTD